MTITASAPPTAGSGEAAIARRTAGADTSDAGAGWTSGLSSGGSSDTSLIRRPATIGPAAARGAVRGVVEMRCGGVAGREARAGRRGGGGEPLVVVTVCTDAVCGVAGWGDGDGGWADADGVVDVLVAGT